MTGPAIRNDPVFDQTRLHDVGISIDPKDWQSLRANFRSNQYYTANVTIDGEVVLQAGIRSRGDGSRNEEKPGLKLDFNQYVSTQEFHGYKNMVLDNHYTDAAMLRERLAFHVFEAMGIPAPQNAFARLTVNGEYWGLYSLVEPVSKPFLEARLGEKSGNLFDYDYAFHWNFGYRGPDPSEYVPVPFKPETNEDHLDASGLVAFVRTANDAPDATFVRDISVFLDAARFLTYLATENALAETDGFLGEQGVNNFYLYQYGGQNRFVFIPWDKDTSFRGGHYSITQGASDNVLARRLLADPTQLRTYEDALRRAGGFVSTSFLGPKLDQAYGQMREAALTDTKKPFDNTTWELAVAGLRGVIAARSADIQAQLSAP